MFSAIGVSRLRMLNDGEGVTTLAAGFGCPLRCRYCLNPQCFMKEKPWKQYTVQELIDETAIDDLYFQATGGGVVFGGGEPLLQAEFIHEFRQKCPAPWKLSLESSLAVPEQNLRTVIDDIDYFIIDIKDMNPEIYRNYTGQKIDKLLNNLNYLINKVPPEKTVIRLPLIKDYNTASDIQNSKAALEKTGYTRFDIFTYNHTKPTEKRKVITNKPDS